MDFSINFNEEKNQLLKASRKVCFDDVIDAINQNKMIGHMKHINSTKYPEQSLLLVEIKGYIYAIPYVKNIKSKELYLKTVYPSRKLTKIYRKEK